MGTVRPAMASFLRSSFRRIPQLLQHNGRSSSSSHAKTATPARFAFAVAAAGLSVAVAEAASDDATAARLAALEAKIAEQELAIENLHDVINENCDDEEVKALRLIKKAATKWGLDIAGGKVRRSSSRLCLGVEHGDYNGCELFGVGTDRFIWLAFKPNNTGKVRMLSCNFEDQGVCEFDIGTVTNPEGEEENFNWSRFPEGVGYVLKKEGFDLTQGFDAVVLGNIPGGGMSRSASLSLNLVLTMLDVNSQSLEETDFKIVDMAQRVENDFIGSPCGNLDQIMIYYAKAGMGTHFNPATKQINYVPLGMGAPDFSIAALDTGTERPGLEKSTYVIRKGECDQLAAILKDKYGLGSVAEVKDEALYNRIAHDLRPQHPNLVERLSYLYSSGQRFNEMLGAWREGDVKKVGELFRADGRGLRDEYSISGPELQTMCDLVRTVPGVLGERMLGGGDKGASGAIVLTESVPAMRKAIEVGYKRAYPELKNKYAVHVVQVTDGIRVIEGVL